MNKIVVPTEFNKTGKRVLTLPLHGQKVFAPAYQRYRKARQAADDEWWGALDSAKHEYVETMPHSIALCVASDYTTAEERYRVIKSLALQLVRPINPEGGPGAGRWSQQLGLGALVRAEDKAWGTYVNVCCAADSARQTASDDASFECGDMKRALWREITDCIHQQHPRHSESKGDN